MMMRVDVSGYERDRAKPISLEIGYNTVLLVVKIDH